MRRTFRKPVLAKFGVAIFQSFHSLIESYSNRLLDHTLISLIELELSNSIFSVTRRTKSDVSESVTELHNVTDTADISV